MSTYFLLLVLSLVALALLGYFDPDKFD